MKRSNKIIFTIIGAVLFIVLVVNVVLALASEEKKSGAVQVIMENYFAIGNTLAQDNFKGVDKNAENMAEASSRILKDEKPNSSERKESLAKVKQIQTSAEKFVSKDLKSSRESYKALSAAVTDFVKANGYSDPAYSFYCPMADQTWFQAEEKIANPFYGSQMLRCGKMTGMVKEGKYLEKGTDEKDGHKH
ncbi:hypothetical protein A2W24_03665 [Microgenomates group bacterium RBG_16_45_19]|nr:MAG: hypothetical protein A2W24_03665 [Microgenomates group bacterium RBG_16_45_19]